MSMVSQYPKDGEAGVMKVATENDMSFGNILSHVAATSIP